MLPASYRARRTSLSALAAIVTAATFALHAGADAYAAATAPLINHQAIYDLSTQGLAPQPLGRFGSRPYRL